MKLKDILSPSFKSVGREIGMDVSVVNGQLHIIPLTSYFSHQVDFILPSMKMVDACRADDFDFFQPAIDVGLLTVDQMHHAAERYCLGKTKGGQPIFWMIDDMLQPLDAHIAPDSWISTILKRREPLLQSWCVQHCLFGLHLLSHTEITENTEIKSVSSVKSVVENMPIAIVESERSAVVLSELFPESLWMAYVSTPHLAPDLLAPLEGRTVTIYPRTDSTMSTYLFFLDYAELVLRHHSLDLHIDSTLEDHATNSQKSRCIDILDFILDTS